MPAPAPGFAKLHVAASLQELNERSELPALVKRVKAESLVKKADTMFKEADNWRAKRDEEQEYIFLMRYLRIFELVRKSKEYEKERRYYDAMLSRKKFSDAVTRSENLTERLEQRYDQAKKKLAPDTPKIVAEVKSTPSTFSAPSPVKPLAEDDFSMTPRALYALMTQRSTSFLLLDARPAEDYVRSRILLDESLNIPERLLRPGGFTAKAIERGLGVASRPQWLRRNSVDRLILLDWDSQVIDDSAVLRALQDSMYKWDTEVQYRCPRPYILRGGFETFAITYPMKVSDPKAARRPKKSQASTASNGLHAKWEDVAYPELDSNGFIVMPNASNSNVSSDADLASLALSSGAVSVSKPTPQPLIPDRSSKPSGLFNNAILLDTSARSSSNDHTSSSIVEPSRSFPVDDPNESVTSSSSDASAPPMIDRSLKAKMLVSQMHRGGVSGQLKEVLQAEDDLVEDSIALEKKELSLESNWNMVRLKKEKEAEEGMKVELAKKEEQLLEELHKLGEQKKARDLENEELRQQLQKMKLRAQQETKDRQAEERMKEEIMAKEKRQRELHAEVEAKRRERKERQKRKEEEERKKQREEEAMKRQREEEAMKKQRDKEEEERRRQQELQQPRPVVKKAPLRDDNFGVSSGGGLNRSYSSPNIAKLVDEEMEKQYRVRDIQGVLSSKKLQEGLTGLKNLGNTCYMNSVLQCLSNFRLPAIYFMDRNKFQRHLNQNSETCGHVANEFSALLSAMWSGQYRSIAPVDLKRVVGRYKEEFRGNGQQDAHEFLLTLMNWLHSDVNEIRRKVILPEAEFEKLSEMEAAKAAWEHEKIADHSFIRETFYGQRKSSLVCLTCGYESFKFESFFELSVQLPPGNNRCTLDQCLEAYLKPETVEWHCPKCKRERDSHKKMDIVKLPVILTVHLARFYQDYGVWRKKQNLVDFRLSDVRMSDYVRACGKKLNYHNNYQLYGVCNHFGSMEGGHYTAYCYSQVHGRWHKFDDQDVTPMGASDVRTSAAYMLFYSAIN